MIESVLFQVKARKPLIVKKIYNPPTEPLYATSTYTEDYRTGDKWVKPVDSFKPQFTYKLPSPPFSDKTCHRKDYVAWDKENVAALRSSPIRPRLASTSLGEETGFPGISSYMSDYKFPFNTEQLLPFKPREEYIPPSGPFCGLTTYKQDFIAKEMKKPLLIQESKKAWPQPHPFQGVSVTHQDYQTYANGRPASNCKPLLKYEPPVGNLESKTIHRQHFVEWELPFRQNLPWAARPTYRPPNVPMEKNTLYQDSFHFPKPPISTKPVKPKNYKICERRTLFDRPVKQSCPFTDFVVVTKQKVNKQSCPFTDFVVVTKQKRSTTIFREHWSMADDTCYHSDYQPWKMVAPPTSCKIVKVYQPPKETFHTETTSNSYYKGEYGPRADLVKPPISTHAYGAQFDGRTVYRDSFKGPKQVYCPAYKINNISNKEDSPFTHVKSAGGHQFYAKKEV
ncbi:stabilizer of axonemal microtubules 1-like [Limulus polyphemus]|uniref:Stabilizer of axonemal microtubules 1-like n=1 Tax=Limulus polyphemus TaxID=6850 RepID=A0ABM1TIU0_LIMPO|nr:stabilizer of axonemal microtubules 1-like [Limulus polyphemus]